MRACRNMWAKLPRAGGGRQGLHSHEKNKVCCSAVAAVLLGLCWCPLLLPCCRVPPILLRP